MPGTKHHIVRIDDARWQRLQELAKRIITTNRPAFVRNDSGWQLTELLRLIADGKVEVKLVE